MAHTRSTFSVEPTKEVHPTTMTLYTGRGLSPIRLDWSKKYQPNDGGERAKKKLYDKHRAEPARMLAGTPPGSGRWCRSSTGDQAGD